MLGKNKRNVNIITYYMSRYLNEVENGKIKKHVSYKKLGFKNRSQTHKTVAERFNVKEAYVKNTEDMFDRIHDNHRVGHKRELRPAQKEIVNSFKDINENELLIIVKSLIKGELDNAIHTIKQIVESDDWVEAPNDDLNNLHKIARKIRKGQSQFRKNLLKVFGGKFVITGCSVKEVLEAAHIVRYSITGNNKTSNGILLRSDIHSLFDSNKLRINPYDFSIQVDISLKDSSYWNYNNQKISKGLNGQYPNKESLKDRYYE